MNKRQAKKNRKAKQEVWYITIDRGVDGKEFAPHPRKGYVRNRKFIDIDTGIKYNLQSIRTNVFYDLLKAADYIDDEYTLWCSAKNTSSTF